MQNVRRGCNRVLGRVSAERETAAESAKSFVARSKGSGTKNKSVGRYWIATVPFEQWTSPKELPADCEFICGQAEEGESTGRS